MAEQRRVKLRIDSAHMRDRDHLVRVLQRLFGPKLSEHFVSERPTQRGREMRWVASLSLVVTDLGVPEIGELEAQLLLEYVLLREREV